MMASPHPSVSEVAAMDLMGLTECAEELGIQGVDDFKTDEEYRDAIFRHLQSTARFRESPSSPAYQDAIGADIPSALEIGGMDLVQLSACADELGIKDCDDFETAEEYRDAIFQHIKQRVQPDMHKQKTKRTPFADAVKIFSDFAKKQQHAQTLIARTKQLVDRADIGPWKQKLNLPQLSSWMTDKDFNKSTDSIIKGKPVLLVAGSTSSGKSTLLNALLGASILPTSHNAATSVLCEISCSKDGSKYALLTMEGRKKKGLKRLDLTKQEGHDKFRKYVSPSRDQPFPGSKGKRCLKAEIFWPLDFLKEITLLDSPGVTEEEGEDAAARQIVDQCQHDTACGFIYVLNGTIAAEEGAQVGGLLQALVKGSKQLPPPDSAIFVINKWDILCQQQNEDERENFLNRTRHEIAKRWPGFKDRQLLTMNARLASRMREMGETTNDLQNLCDAITAVLPVGMDYLVVRSLNPVHSLTSTIEHLLQESLYELNLPSEERMKKWKEDWERFDTFRRSMEDGRIAIIRNSISEEIKRLVKELAEFLKSDTAKRIALKWKKEELGESEQKMFDGKQAKELVQERFVKAITQSEHFDKFTRWASGKIMEDVQTVVKELRVLEAEVSNVSPAGDPGELLRKFGQELGQFGGMQKAAAAALTIAMVLVAPVVLALGTLQVTLVPLYKLADLISSMSERRFRKVLEQGYKELLEKSCENDCLLLSQTVTDIVENAVEPVKLAFKTIPARIDDLKQRLESRASHEAADIPMFESALSQVSQITGSLAKFELELNIHEFEAEDITWRDRDKPQSRGSFGAVFEVSLPGRRKAVLKLLDEPITELTASDRFKMLLTWRKFHNPKNVISFRGSVVVSHSPLQLGFLFEDSGNLTLADLIFGVDWELPSTRNGFSKAMDTVLPMLDGLDYLHENAVVHGRLAPDTILITKPIGGTVKLSEPSTSSPVVDEFTPLTPYLAPEILNKQRGRQSADMYSLGVILWEMLGGRRAYSKADLESMGISEFVCQVTDERIHPGISLATKAAEVETAMTPLSASWDALAHKCFSSIERNRPTLGEVREAFQVMREQLARKKIKSSGDQVTGASDKQKKAVEWRHTLATRTPEYRESLTERFRLYSEQVDAVTTEAAVGDTQALSPSQDSADVVAKVDQAALIQHLRQLLQTDKHLNSDLKSQVDEQQQISNCLQKQVEELEQVKQDLETTQLATEEKLKKFEEMALGHIPDQSLNITDTCIGFGKLGEVHVALWKGAAVAVKILNITTLTDQNLRHFADELVVASHIRHPNIASVFGVVMSNGLPWQTVMELLEGSISDLISAAALTCQYLTVREQVDLSMDIVLGLMHLHELKPKAVVHGDLRPTNILVTATMVAKISDIGTWRVLGSYLPPGPLTFSYLAPERQPSQSSVVPRTTTEADLYGLGVTLLEIFTGQPASRRERGMQLREVSFDSLRQMCVELTEDNPQSRLSIQEALMAVEHAGQDPKYRQAPNRRLVRGKPHGGSCIALIDSPW